MGQGQLVAALQRLAVMHGTDATADLAHGVFHDFRLKHADGIGADGALLERSLQTL